MGNHVNEGGGTGSKTPIYYDPDIFKKHIVVYRKPINLGLTIEQRAELMKILNKRRPYNSGDYNRQGFFPDL